MPEPTFKTWIVVVGATLGAFMAVLNIQIVNATLADIIAALFLKKPESIAAGGAH